MILIYMNIRKVFNYSKLIFFNSFSNKETFLVYYSLNKRKTCGKG